MMRMSKRCLCVAGVFCTICVCATIAVEALSEEAQASHPDTINATISNLTFQSSGTGTVSPLYANHLSGYISAVYGEYDYVPVDRRTPDTPFLSTTPASMVSFDQLKQRAQIFFKLE
jgi:hypothetical protein